MSNGRLSGSQPAINGQTNASDGSSRIAAQKRHGVRNIRGLDCPLERIPLHHLLKDLRVGLDPLVPRNRVHGPRRDGIGPHAIPPIFDRDGLCQMDQPRLGRAVCRMPEERQPINRRYIHNRPAGLLQRILEGMEADKRRLAVQGAFLLPDLGRHIVQAHGPRSAGVVDQGAQLAARQHLGGHGRYLVFIRDICGDCGELVCAQFRGEEAGSGFVEVDQEDVVVGFGEFGGDGAADITGCAGHDGKGLGGGRHGGGCDSAYPVN